ncbi:MAG: UDP-glucose 6-dehydrogenase, partial [Porphyrobacter sp.]|nr:UDP-glucose 6-dehydrogenase [Porphyrobacter sp.]
PAIAVAQTLMDAGVAVAAYDPEGMEQARPLLPGVTMCEGAYEAIEGADVVVIVTEWDAFRALDLKRVKDLLNAPVMVDLRNVYKPDDMRNAGFEYTSVGRS